MGSLWAALSVVEAHWRGFPGSHGHWWSLMLPLAGWLIVRWPGRGVPLFLVGMPLIPIEVEWVAVSLAGVVVLRTGWELRQRGVQGLGRVARIAAVGMLLWLAWALISAAASAHPGLSLVATLRWAALAMAGWACGAWWGLGRRWIVAGAAILLLQACYAGLLFPWHSKAGSLPFFLNTNDLSAAMALSYPAMVALIRVTRRLRQMAYQTILLGGLELVYAFHGRAVWLTLGLATFLYPLVLLRKLPFRVLYGALILAVTAWYFHWRVTHPTWKPTTTDAVSQLKSIGNLGGDFSNRERAMRWECARRMVLDRPILGQGPGRFPEELPHFLHGKKELERISYWFGWKHGAHNDALTLLAETGWPGAALFVGLVGLSVVAALRRVRWGRGLRHPAAVLALTLVMWVILSCFNDTFEDPRLLAWGFLLMGLATRSGSQDRAPSAPKAAFAD